MRLFFAIHFNNDTISRLLALRSVLQANARRGSFPAPENLHLTLAFLGECSERQTAAAEAALDTLVFEPFAILIDRVGCFRRGGSGLWWAGVRNDAVLFELQGALTARLHEAGFLLESRSYNPHITLRREVVTDYMFGRMEPFGEIVTSAALMKSERINGKLTYTAIFQKRACRP